MQSNPDLNTRLLALRRLQIHQARPSNDIRLRLSINSVRLSSPYDPDFHMDLANELVLEVCRHLPKPALKACRLVSKSWSHHASEYLFSKIYISPRKEDIEVFNLITQHTQLSRCVRHLDYDGTTFPLDYSVEKYCSDLAGQTSQFSGLYKSVSDGPDPQLRQFIAVLSKNAREVDIEQELMMFPFILKGHREWIERAEYQKMILNDGEFLRILTHGLEKLKHLASVAVLSIWDTQALSGRSTTLSDHKNGSQTLKQPYFFDSPFGRSWGILHPEPLCWQKTPGKGRYQEYHIITVALSQSQRRIRSLKLEPLSFSIFDTNQDVSQSIISHSINSFSSLHTLTLCFEVYDEETGLKDTALPGLQAVLNSTTALRFLTLSLGYNEICETPRLRYNHVFPTDGKWMSLTHFELSTLALKVTDLIYLLTVRMPNVRKLGVRDLELLEGRWEGVIESLKRSMQFKSFSLLQGWDIPGCQLVHLGGRYFLGDEHLSDKDSAFRKALEEYVVSGGRHPCLRWDEDASASRKYILDLGV